MYGVTHGVEKIWRSNVALAAMTAAVLLLNMAACLVVYFCRRRSGNKSARTFLLALTLETMAIAIVPGAVYSVTQVMGWMWVKQVCGGLTWSFATLALLEAVTGTSALVDRLYAVRWRLRYRNRVTQAQLRYHVTVCALLCASLAAVPTFLRVGDRFRCPFLPYSFTFGYGAFVCVVYVLLALVTAVCLTLLVRLMRRVERDGLGTDIVFLNKNKLASLPPHLTPRGATYAPTAPPENEALSGGGAAERSVLAVKLNSLQNGGGGDSWNRRRTPRGGVEDVKRCTDQWKTLAIIVAADYLFFHLPLLVITVLGTVTMTSIISNTALLEHCVIWLMVGKGVLLPVLLLVVDAEYRRYVLAKLFPCCCEADKVQEKSQLSTLDLGLGDQTYEDFGGTHGLYLSHGEKLDTVDSLAEATNTQCRLVMTPSYKLDTKEKVERHRSKRSAFPGVDPKVPSKRRQWKESIIRQQMPALYDYINEAFKALEDQQKLLGGGGGGVSQHPKSSAMRRSTSLDNVESRQTGQDSGYEDHMNGGYETDPGETGKAEVAASNMSLYRTADIAVVLDRPDKQGHRQVQLYQMTPDGDNVVRLFPNQSDSDSDNGTPPPPTPSGDGDGDADESAEQVYVIPVQNYGAMNVYKVNIADGKMAGLTADASAAAEPDSDTDTEIVTLAPMMDVIKAADKSPVAQNVEFYSRLAGATTAASSPANTKTAVKKVKNPERSNRRESIKQAVKMALMTEYFSEDDPDSGHEATAERKPREIRSPPPAPPAAAQQQEEEKQEKEAEESTGYRLRAYPPARPLPVEEVFAARAIQVSRPADAHREALVLRNSRRGRPYDFFAPLTPRNAQRTYPPPPYGAPKHARPPGGAKAPPAYPGRREAPADGALASSRPVMRRESINRALHVATLFRPTYHHSDTDLRPRNSQFADVLPSVYLDRGAANHRQAALRRMTIPEDMFEDDASSPGSSETGACSGTRAARNSLRRDPGPDLSLVAYF